MQAGRIQKSVQLYLPNLHTGRVAGLGHRHRAVTPHRQAGGVLRNGDGRLHWVAAGGHQLTGLIGLEGAVAGIRRRAVRHQDLEKAQAVNRHIFRVVGLDRIALRVDAFGSHYPDTRADLQTGRHAGLVRGLTAALAQVLVEQVFKHGAAAFEAGSANVGEVVGDHVELGLLSV